jgi:hypothetical protein
MADLLEQLCFHGLASSFSMVFLSRVNNSLALSSSCFSHWLT